MNGFASADQNRCTGLRTATNFIAIAYLRMAKLKHVPANPLRAAVPRDYGIIRHTA